LGEAATAKDPEPDKFELLDPCVCCTLLS
jgi:hypothetical protein